MPRAGVALSIGMTCALAVTAIRLLLFHEWSLLSLSVGLAAPALAVLFLMMILRLFGTLDCPATFVESSLVAGMHVLSTVPASFALAVAYPDLASDPRFLVAFEWHQINAWLPLICSQLVLVPLAARG